MFRGPTWAGSIQQALIEKFWVAVMSCDTSVTSLQKPPMEESEESDTTSEDNSEEDSDSDLELETTEGNCTLVNRFDLLSVIGVGSRYQGQDEATTDRENGPSFPTVLHQGTSVRPRLEMNVLLGDPNSSQTNILPNSSSGITFSKWRKTRIPKLSPKYSLATLVCEKCQLVPYRTQSGSGERVHIQSRIPVYRNIEDRKIERGPALCTYHASRPYTGLIARKYGKYHSSVTRLIIPQASSTVGRRKNIFKPQIHRNMRMKIDKKCERMNENQSENKIKIQPTKQASCWKNETRNFQRHTRKTSHEMSEKSRKNEPRTIQRHTPSSRNKTTYERNEKCTNKMLVHAKTSRRATQSVSESSKWSKNLSSNNKKLIGKQSSAGLMIPPKNTNLKAEHESEKIQCNSDSMVKDSALQNLPSTSTDQVDSKNSISRDDTRKIDDKTDNIDHGIEEMNREDKRDNEQTPPESKSDAIATSMESTVDGVDDLCLEQCIREAILGVVQDLPEGWILVRPFYISSHSHITSIHL